MQCNLHNVKNATFTLLNGISVGTMIALMPGALLFVPLSILGQSWAGAIPLLKATMLCNSVVGFSIGVAVGAFFKMTPIQMISIGLASFYAGGAGHLNATGDAWILGGTGDIVTISFTAALAVFFIKLVEKKLQSFTLLLTPLISLLLAGGIGSYLYPYISQINTYIGEIVTYAISLQPYLLSVCIALLFSCLIMTPITCVGLALAISLSGLGAGAASLGICATAFSFCIGGWRVNSIGTSLAHWLAAPKISMAVAFAHPKLMLPPICGAFIMGIVAAFFNIQGTPLSAGFGMAGFMGPGAALAKLEGGASIYNIVKIVFIFAGMPTILGIIFNYLFVDVLKVINKEDYFIKLN